MLEVTFFGGSREGQTLEVMPTAARFLNVIVEQEARFVGTEDILPDIPPRLESYELVAPNVAVFVGRA